MKSSVKPCEALKSAPSAGSRNRLWIEKAIAKLAMDTLGTVYSTNMWHQEPGHILASYLVDEKVGAKETEKMKFEGQEVSENGGQEITSKVEEDEGRCRGCAKFCDFENDHLAL